MEIYISLKTHENVHDTILTTKFYTEGAKNM